MIVALIAFLALAPPIVDHHVGVLGLDGGGCREARIDTILGLDRVAGDVKFTSAAWRSAVTSVAPSSGDLTSSTYWSFDIRPVTSSTAAWNSESSSVSVSLFSSTTSSTGLRPASSSACSASWLSPVN